MNIQISDSWLREFIETKATHRQIGEYLSLCGQSVEKIISDGKDFIYDIEITTNRPDCLSVYGIARELSAILPRFGIPIVRRDAKFCVSTIASQGEALRQGLPLQIKITKPDLCPRFTALTFDNITIKPSPDFVQKRLNASGIRALNNVIDISNYLMLELGQPMHTFDYDKILKHKMILREAKSGEEVITLDGQTRKLADEMMIIEDGEGRIIDLCGIMGAKNSETDENTKRVLLFVQTYNPMKIRRACQLLSFRTEAASRFEKGIDPEGVIPAMQRATLLFKEWCGGKIASKLFDIYPNPQKEIQVSVSKSKIDSLVGIEIPLAESKNILENLGFKVKTSKDALTATIPHWRADDIAIPEDLIEEIARIYGYHNLPNVLPPITTLDKPKDITFDWEYKIKTALKYWGFTEVMSYSLTNKNLATDADNQLKISNPLTEDLLYLRTSLIPSLLNIIEKNSNEKEIEIFEMANVYLSNGKTELPDEKMNLTLMMTGERYLHLKGIMEELFKELGIEKYALKLEKSSNMENYTVISIGDKEVGIIGNICRDAKFCVSTLDLEIDKIISIASGAKKYLLPSKYPSIVEDLSFIVPSQTFIGPIIEEIKKVDEIIKRVEYIDSFENTRTFRIIYQSDKQNLTDKEVREVREKIIEALKNKFKANLKIK